MDELLDAGYERNNIIDTYVFGQNNGNSSVAVHVFVLVWG
jgi:hypothetical protein